MSAFVAWISPKDSAVQVLRTGLYRPAMVAVAPDGTLWTVGRELENLSRPAKVLPQAGVLRHYDKSGKTLHLLVPQSTLRNPSLTLSRNTLRASKDRVAWYEPGDGRYLEISFGGEVLTDVVAEMSQGEKGGEGAPMTGDISFALTAEGDAFVSIPYIAPKAKHPVHKMYSLDRPTRSWRAVNLPSANAQGPTGYIFGAEANQLVILSGKTVQFYSVSK